MSAQVILLTGANGGIGFSITRKLLALSSVALVVAIDLNGNQLKTLLPEYSGKLEIILGDIRERSTSREAIEKAISRAGRLDCIILNAAIQRPVGRITETKVEDWQRLFDVDFFALLHTIQLAAHHLRKTRGRIIMTSSGVSLTAYGAWAAYGCAKATMNYLCLIWPKEEPDINIVCLTPGIVDTGLQRECREEESMNLPKDTYGWLSNMHREGELLRPEEPAARFVALAVDGIPKEMVGTVVKWNDPRFA